MSPELNFILTVVCVLIAAVIRGLTGFGFAAIAVVGMAMLGPLNEAVPIVLSLEVASSLMLLRGALPHTDYPQLRRLLIAAALGVPCGIWLLTGLNSDWLNTGVYVLVGLLALLGLARITLPMGKGQLGGWIVGGCSGALIAAFSIGGPLVGAGLSHSGLKAVALRATLILFFFVVDLAALIGLGLAHAIPDKTAEHVLYLIPALLAGLWAGQQLFVRIRAEHAARFTQWLLLALAGFGLLGRAWS
ncbi:sulfite exporter TauE/SafE family protein [Pseudomonas sp. LS-2]|uniref:sulfite exporter TauE/SafE family protein n=1 Tax=Pseudomonas sp. LS-2 TaxID=2315859 RepID=UPI000E7198BA|nr:sulfite exporter TauE/SafE family protein [Pseudomonas sp. LS-2]RJX73457.1 sulfite exporter TauE/SafE family protein [Pseudomonas sp. LS-2]